MSLNLTAIPYAKAVSDCLGMDLLFASGHTGDDPTRTFDRALLRGKAGGAAIRPLSHRPHALTSSTAFRECSISLMLTVLRPMASFHNLSTSLVSTRLSPIILLRATPYFFKDKYKRHKSIFEDRALSPTTGTNRRRRSVLSLRQSSVTLWCWGQNIQKPIIGERQRLMATQVLRRDQKLPFDKEHRKSCLKITTGDFATHLLTGLPEPGALFKPPLWR